MPYLSFLGLNGAYKRIQFTRTDSGNIKPPAGHAWLILSGAFYHASNDESEIAIHNSDGRISYYLVNKMYGAIAAGWYPIGFTSFDNAISSVNSVLSPSYFFVMDNEYIEANIISTEIVTINVLEFRVDQQQQEAPHIKLNIPQPLLVKSIDRNWR